jgi:hypothetical protein
VLVQELRMGLFVQGGEFRHCKQLNMLLVSLKKICEAIRPKVLNTYRVCMCTGTALWWALVNSVPCIAS